MNSILESIFLKNFRGPPFCVCIRCLCQIWLCQNNVQQLSGKKISGTREKCAKIPAKQSSLCGKRISSVEWEIGWFLSRKKNTRGIQIQKATWRSVKATSFACKVSRGDGKDIFQAEEKFYPTLKQTYHAEKESETKAAKDRINSKREMKSFTNCQESSFKL